MNLIEEILKETPDTKACRLGPGVTEQVAELFGELFPAAKRALVVDDVNTKRVAGDRVIALLNSAGIEVSEYTINPDGSWFHATYDKVEEVRDVIKANWPELSAKLKSQIMPFGEVVANLKAVGAPYEPEMIGVSRAKFRETYRGVQYMRNRYFSIDLVSRLGLMDAFLSRLFGPNGVWSI